MQGRTTFPALVAGLSLVALAGTISACSTKRDAATGGDTAAMADTGMGASTMPAPNTVGADSAMSSGDMMTMTAEDSAKADQQFLRKMSDHHSGLIAMTEIALNRSDSVTIKDDARKLNTAQVAERDTMLNMLKTKFSDNYSPTITPPNRAMNDSLKATTDPRAFSRLFLQNVNKHHQSAIMMINNFMPLLKTPQLRTMAMRMKRDQTAEIQKFTAELKSM